MNMKPINGKGEIMDKCYKELDKIVLEITRQNRDNKSKKEIIDIICRNSKVRKAYRNFESEENGVKTLGVNPEKIYSFVESVYDLHFIELFEVLDNKVINYDGLVMESMVSNIDKLIKIGKVLPKKTFEVSKRELTLKQLTMIIEN